MFLSIAGLMLETKLLHRRYEAFNYSSYQYKAITINFYHI